MIWPLGLRNTESKSQVRSWNCRNSSKEKGGKGGEFQGKFRSMWSVWDGNKYKHGEVIGCRFEMLTWMWGFSKSLHVSKRPKQWMLNPDCVTFFNLTKPYFSILWRILLKSCMKEWKNERMVVKLTLIRKKIEMRNDQLYPNEWTPGTSYKMSQIGWGFKFVGVGWGEGTSSLCLVGWPDWKRALS